MAGAQNGKIATIFGASGFVGRHIVRSLARRGWRIRAAERRPDLAGHLQPLGGPGQIQPVQANLRYPWSVDRAIEGTDAVVNLVGILYPTGRQSFLDIHKKGAAAVAGAAIDAGVDTIVHMSAIGADANSPSEYARSKAAGEGAVREIAPGATIMRPSIVFGPEDMFFNRFAALARLSPVLPLIGGGHTKFQPVFVGDVAEAFARVVDGEARAGLTYELGGPQIKSFKECLDLMLEIIGRKRLLVPLPFGLAKFEATFLQMLPKPLLTVDQVRLLERDNVVCDAAVAEGRTLEALGVVPTTLAAILPTYLDRFRVHGHYESRRPA